MTAAEWMDYCTKRAAEIRKAGTPKEVALDEVILGEFSGGAVPVLEAIVIMMRAFNLSLGTAKVLVEGRCYELKQEGRKT